MQTWGISTPFSEIYSKYIAVLATVTSFLSDGQPRVHDDQVGEDVRIVLDQGESDQTTPILTNQGNIVLQTKVLHQLTNAHLKKG